MKKIILFVILDKFSEWEAAYLAPLIYALGQDKYCVKTVSLTKDNVHSLGGFTVIPDYDILSAPKDYEGLVLIGGMTWREEASKQVSSLVKHAFENNRVLAGICDASAFLGTLGVLNTVKHTSNALDDLKQWAGDAYSGEENYICEPAVRDNNIITANGTSSLEFAKEVLTALNIAPEQKICEWYNFHKLGFYGASIPSV